jgi:hypothetical protein
MIICNNCGVGLDDNIKICPLCGKDPLVSSEELPSNNLSGTIGLDHKEIRKSLRELIGIIAFCGIAVCTIVDLIISKKPGWSLYTDVSIISGWLTLSLFIFAYRRPQVIIPGQLLTVLATLFMIDLLSTGGKWFLPLAFPLTIAVSFSAGLILVLYRIANLKGLNIVALSLLVLAGLCIIIEILTDKFQNGYVDLHWSLIVAISIFPVSLLILFYHYRLRKNNRLDSYFHI